MKRFTIGFPEDLEKKVQIMADENYNSFAGTVLFIVADWLKQNMLKQSSPTGHVTIHAETDDVKRIRLQRLEDEAHRQKKRRA